MATSGTKEALKTVGKVAAPVAGAFTLSHVLQQLSGHALWVPTELRVGVEAFTTLLGTIVFLLVAHRMKHAAPQQKTADARAAKRASELKRALLWSAAAVLLFVSYMWLRTECVVSWDPTQWLKDNELSDRTKTPADIAEFVDLERGSVYVPLVFPEKGKRYIERAAAASEDRGVEGLQWMLQHEPDHFFDWLRTEWRMQRWATSTLFLLDHLAIVACVAVAAALAGARLGTMQEAA